jgi:heme exporter protein CcmD
MIEGGWNYVWPAYAIALGALGVLAFVVLQRARVWARRMRELDGSK